MMTLKRPVSVADEDKKLASVIAKKGAGFGVHEPVWKRAYANYRAGQGDPWKVNPSTFAPSIRDQQLKLYESRKGSGPIKRIRDTPNLKCCPVCGSPCTGTLDHYLPKEDYPEFSILASNLVPACAICNSGLKGKLVKGTSAPERFIHPYFDTWTNAAIWHVDVRPNYAAATFVPSPDPSLSGTTTDTVRFHLSNILGTQFDLQMATYWHSLPDTLACHADLTVDMAKAWAAELLWSELTLGLNGWRTALVRGLLHDRAARSYVEDLALQKVAP